MKKIICIATISLFINMSVFAAEETLTPDAEIKVNGLVCDFCAQATEKVFRKRDEVQDIDVNLKNGLVTLDFKDGKTISDEELEKLISDSGYSLVEIKRAKSE
ncbi:MAG: heavy metal-associated domain-containing protein [Bdellovibrionota bacterium]